MYAIICVLPVLVLQRYQYARQTRQTFNLTSSFFTKILLFVSWLLTLIKFYELENKVNSGFGISEPSKEVMFMQAMMDDINNSVYNFPTLIAFLCFFTWLLLLSALTRTQMFGPRISMVMRMIADIMEFLVIYAIQLFAFSLFACMAFVQVSVFNGLYDASLYLFSASFGNFEL